MIWAILVGSWGVSVGVPIFFLKKVVDRNDSLTEALDTMRRREGVPMPVPQPVERPESRRLPDVPTAI